MFKSKIHRAIVTHADLKYIGSLTADLEPMEVADLFPGEQVSIVDVTNGARLETYLIAGARRSGVIGINGAAAHLVGVGDTVIVISYAQLSDEEARTHKPRIVHVNERNEIVAIGHDPAEALTDGVSTPPHAI